ncbi:chalcone isomerase family protein [Aquabacterium sp.]|uniref:chalcone isomerase family protein n=1 Tax=Aquabacterium sp. TaxID=1872578 RepID=UPI0035B43750
MNRRSIVLGGAAATMLSTLPRLSLAAPVDIAGVKYEPTITLGGQKLVLNGAGIRYKFILKIYALGLYLPKKADTMEEVIQMEGPKRLQLVPLRDLSTDSFGRLVTKGIQTNASREEFVKILPDITRIGQLFSSFHKMEEGDALVMDWIPGTGMIATYKGQVQGDPFKHPEFFHTILKIWLGSAPPDNSLKEALLGGKPGAAKPTGTVTGAN